jgi:hypothetical protein
LLICALKVDGLAPVSLIVESGGVDDENNGKLRNDAKDSPLQLPTPTPLRVGEPSDG